MRRSHWIVVLLIAGSISLNAQDTLQAERNWSNGTAYVLPQGRFEIGVFQPLRYGLRDNLEISVHPLWFFVAPNVRVKWEHGGGLATRHSIYYPTPFLRVVAKKGIGGLISPEFAIPHMAALRNDVIYTMRPFEKQYFSLMGGLEFAVRFGALDKRTTIDFPWVYNRLAVFYNDFGIRLGLDWYGCIKGNWWYRLDGELFYYSGSAQTKAFEHSGKIYWRYKKRWEISAGYNIIYGEYPYGNEWNWFLPMIDIRYAWNY
ncbi:MAG TPA: hypothetical protein ENK44_10470 [Caldithrix abyssi]|uniref:DUF3575 domain-containing protein n=1 Tax=Caldithrix abyssi TaxID=187145 RepID=A0A7V4WVQ7_CALAY|nr:hypothetical protein [Caldithrix abyssi]